MSAQQYQLTRMQFELLSFWRGIEEQDLARIPEVEVKPDSTARKRSRNGGVAVLIFSNQSLVGYVSQFDAIPS